MDARITWSPRRLERGTTDVRGSYGVGQLGRILARVWPDGALLASGSADDTVRLWNTATGTAIKTLEGYRVRSVAFSPDGVLLASNSGKTVRLWDTMTGVAVKTLEGHTRVVRSVVFSPDGALLASSSEGKTVRLCPYRLS
jgi:WD40 repeat protein